MSSNTEETDPNFKTRAKDAARKATEAADPWADRLLDSAKASAYTPWLIVGAVVLCIIFGVILSR